MKRRRIFLTSACFFCAATGFEAGAQTCHTVRDQDGTIVYQSTLSPSDAPDTKQLVADAMQAGGTLRYESNFIRCGSFDRSVSSPMTAIAVEPPTSIEVPAPRQQATRPAVDRNFVHAAPDKPPPPPNPAPTAAELAQYGDFAKYVPTAKAAIATPNPFEHLVPKPASPTLPGPVKTNAVVDESVTRNTFAPFVGGAIKGAIVVLIVCGVVALRERFASKKSSQNEPQSQAPSTPAAPRPPISHTVGRCPNPECGALQPLESSSCIKCRYLFNNGGVWRLIPTQIQE